LKSLYNADDDAQHSQHEIKHRSLDVTASEFMPLSMWTDWSGRELDLWPMTLKTFIAIPNRVMKICGRFHWKRSLEDRDISTSREIGVQEWTDNGRTDRWPENITLSAYHSLLRHMRQQKVRKYKTQIH